MDKFQNVKPTKMLKTDSTFKDSAEQLEERAKHIDMWSWKYHGGLLHGSNVSESSDIHKRTKVAMFDMDGTLIHGKSGDSDGKPLDENDWIWYDKEKVPSKLKAYFKNGYRICIITNQKGISTGKVTDYQIKKKIEIFVEEICVPVQVFICSSDDEFRKPLPGAFNFIKENLMKPHGIEPDMQESFFVGDAAGRPKTAVAAKDFSDFDIKFARNCGLKFFVPEEFFKGQDGWNDLKINLDLAERNPFYNIYLKSNDKSQPLMHDFENPSDTKDILPSQEFKTSVMVINMGPPGSGKSTFCKNYLPNFVRVNNDEYNGNSKKSLQKAKQAISDGKNLVIDNTNRDVKTRKDYINQAEKQGYEIYAFYFKMEKVNAIFWDNLRLNNETRKHISKRVGPIPVHTWYKNFEKPDQSEGYAAIKVINPIMKLDTEYEKSYYNFYTEIKYR